jgi:hypothetical protein
VAAALDRQEQVTLAGEGHRPHHVGGAGRLHDQRRMAVDARVQHAAGLVVAFEAGQQQAAAQGALQLLQRRLFQRDLGAAAGYGVDVAADLAHRGQGGSDGLLRGQGSGYGGGQGGLQEAAAFHGRLSLLLLPITIVQTAKFCPSVTAAG